MKKTKILVFDMDGTIADFYNVPNWLEYLENQDATPYKIAKPIYDMDALKIIIEILQDTGWKIVITSWLAKESSKIFDNEVRQAKKEWLEKYSFPYDEIHLVKYGTTKANCTRKLGGYQILIDDNQKIRNGWSLGNVIEPNEDIFEKLLKLISL